MSVTRQRGSGSTVARGGLAQALRARGLECRDDEGTRSQYSSDASMYRVRPAVVVRPRSADDVLTAIGVCREEGGALTARGAGTSVAGNAVGPGAVLDFSRHMNQIVDVDVDAGLAHVQPGATHARLQQRATARGWRFGPDPSTHSRCTVGGMIGNNACGARSLGYGRTSDNVAGLEVLTAGGEWISTGYDSTGRPTLSGGDALTAQLRTMMAGHLATARVEFAKFGRQVSGYAVQHLLPERFDLGQALVGSEGTLGVITAATVRLVREPTHRSVVAVGFDSIADAGAAAPVVAAMRPTACEGLDARLIDVIRSRRGAARVPDLPAGRAWLFVEFAGHDEAEVTERAAELARARLGLESRIVTSAADAGRLWMIREDGAGLAGTAPSGKPAWAGWEDAAVPPHALGAYLVEFDELVSGYGLTSAPYGHFGEGCVHVRLDFPFDRSDGARVFRSFLGDAAALVSRHGGTLSGEHGDGRARSALLPTMYSDDAIKLFSQIKRAFDPTGLLNPGVLVDPDPVDQNVRIANLPLLPARHGFRLLHDGGDLSAAVHRCTGVGKCRADNSAQGGVMCPSYLATKEERDSTRGRARVLQEVVRGERADFDTPEVHAALDLCLSCKGCTSDCPTGVDMPTYKSEVLHRVYKHKLRPRSHYALGRLPLWMRVSAPVAALANKATAQPLLRRLMLWMAGADPRRSIPRFATTTFRRRSSRTNRSPAAGTPVMLFVDSFTNGFDPEAAEAAVAVLEQAGYSVQLTQKNLCCGLTWITTGQLDTAKRILSRTVEQFARATASGIPIVGLEPSCTAVLRGDAVELLGTAAAQAVAANTYTLAELLTSNPAWQPPDLTGVSLIAQPHCHHHGEMGWDADRKLLLGAGATLHEVAGCCGLAGNFGMEAGHYEISVAVAEQNLLPALDADAASIVLADGFSCRTQIADLRGRPSITLAQLLAGHGLSPTRTHPRRSSAVAG